jgi:hypothetical protein
MPGGHLNGEIVGRIQFSSCRLAMIDNGNGLGLAP